MCSGYVASCCYRLRYVVLRSGVICSGNIMMLSDMPRYILLLCHHVIMFRHMRGGRRAWKADGVRHDDASCVSRGCRCLSFRRLLKYLLPHYPTFWPLRGTSSNHPASSALHPLQTYGEVDQLFDAVRSALHPAGVCRSLRECPLHRL